MRSGILQWLGFALVVGAFIYNTTLGIRALGIVEIAVGAYWIKTGQVSYGIRGRPPSGYLTGWPAIAAGVAIIILGIAFLTAPMLVKPFFCGRRACT